MAPRTLRTPTAKPPSTRYDRRKGEILDVAAELINREGLRETTLATVGAQLGMNLKSLRYYFTRKEDLACAAFVRSIDLHMSLVDDALAERAFEARVQRFIRGYFALQARVRRGEQPAFVHFGDIRALSGPSRQQVGASYVRFFRGVRSIFELEDESLEVNQGNAKAHFLISQVLWSVIWIDGYVVEDFARVADRFSDILLNGLASRSLDFAAPPEELHNAFDDGDRLSKSCFLRTATHLINKMGYRGATVDKISAHLNVTKGAFYHHNETRDDLVVACFERTIDIIREAQDQAMAQREADGLDRVAAAAVSLVTRQMVPEGALLRTSALTAISFDLRQQMQHAIARSTMRFADMLNDGLLDGSVRPCDIRIASEMVTAAINSAQELQAWVPGARRDNAAELYLAPLFRGLTAESKGKR